MHDRGVLRNAKCTCSAIQYLQYLILDTNKPLFNTNNSIKTANSPNSKCNSCLTYLPIFHLGSIEKKNIRLNICIFSITMKYATIPLFILAKSSQFTFFYISRLYYLIKSNNHVRKCSLPSK